MAQFTNFLAIPTEKIDNSGYANLFENMMKGYQMAAAPAAMKEDAKAKQLQNALAQQALSPQAMDLDRRYKEAQISNLNYHAPAKPSANEEILQGVENNPAGTAEGDYWRALAKAKTTPKNGITVYDSEGNPTTQIGGTATDLPPLKRGESYYYKTGEDGKPVLDDSGNRIPEGIRVPTTEKEADEYKGRYMMKEIQPAVNKIMSYYTGKGSNERYYADINLAEQGDAGAIQRLTDLATAQKLIAPLTVKEQKTLQASGTLGMYRALQDSMAKDDVNSALKVLGTFKIPSSIQEKAGEHWLKIITDTTAAAADKVPAFQKRPFEVPVNSSAPTGKMYRGPDGKTYTEAQMKQMTGMK